MQEREALLNHSNHTYNHQTNPQNHKEPTCPPTSSECCKNHEEEDHIHATPSTQNGAVDDSAILQEILKRKCINCIDNEKKLFEIEQELRNERKRNLRYLKIINTKVDKEKELQRAYGQIAQELKKKMDAARAGELNKQQQTQIYDKQTEQLKLLRERTNELETTLADTREQLRIISLREEQILKLQQQKKKYEEQVSCQAQQRILNAFYEQQIVQLHQKINELESRMKLQEEQLLSSQKLLNLKKESSPIIDSLPLAVVKSSSSVPDMANNERTSNKSRSYSSSKEAENVQHFNHLSHLKENEEGQILKPFNMSKISSIQARNEHSQLDNIMEEFQQQQSYNTVPEWRSNSFHSINHTQTLLMHQYYLPKESRLSAKEREFGSLLNSSQCDFFSISQAQNNISNASYPHSNKMVLQSQSKNQVSESKNQPQSHEKQSKHQIKSVDHNQILDTVRKEREVMIRFAEGVRNLLEHLGMALNRAGQKYKIAFEMPLIPQLSEQIAEQGFLHEIQGFTLSNDLAEEAGHHVERHIQSIIKLTKKSYEKMLNDQQLHLEELKSKLHHEDEEKRHLGRIVQKLQEHNTKLEYKISEVSEDSPVVSDKQIRETYLRSVIKKKSSIMYQGKFKENFAQCDILPSNIEEIRAAEIENYEKMIQAITFLPKFLNEILKKSNIQGGLSIDLEKDLEPQLEDIIKRSFNLLHIQIVSYPESHIRHKKLRRSSFADNTIFEIEDKNKSKTYFLLEIENNRLHKNIAQKTEKIMALSQKITLQNIERAHLEQFNLKLKEEIESLKLTLADCKHTTTLNKGDHQQSTAKISEHNEKESQEGQFIEYEEKIQFNNLYWDKDQELKSLREKNEIYRQQLKRYESEARKRKKKIIYINN